GYALVGLVPALCFWGLDAYYVRLEKLFRRLYTDVCNKGQGTNNGADFSMDTAPYANQVASWFYVVRSAAVAGPHGPLALAVLLGASIIGVSHHIGAHSTRESEMGKTGQQQPSAVTTNAGTQKK